MSNSCAHNHLLGINADYYPNGTTKLAWRVSYGGIFRVFGLKQIPHLIAYRLFRPMTG
jgi:hypothetical protein